MGQDCQDFGRSPQGHVDELMLNSQVCVAKAYLKSVMTNGAESDITAILHYLRAMPSAFSELLKLFSIALTLLITTAANERFFSALKRVKTYLRATTGDARLSHLMLMTIEQNLVKSFDLDILVNDFANMREHR